MTALLGSGSPWSATLGHLRTVRAEAEPAELAAAAVAGLGLVLALVSPAAPTGSIVGDALVRVGFVALLGFCAVFARTWTWAAFAALAFGAGLASGVGLGLVGAVAVIPSTVAALTPTRSLVLPMAAVTFGSAVLLRLDGDSSVPASVLLGLAVVPMVVSAYQRMPSVWRSTATGVAGVAGAVCLIWTALFAGALLGARGDLEAGVDAAERGVDATRAGDRGVAASELDLAARYFERAHNNLDRPWLRPARMLPFVGIQANAVVQAAATGEDVAEASAVAAGEADLDRLKLDGGRIALDEVEALREPVGDVAAELASASATVDSLDSPWLVGPLRSQLLELADEVDSAAADAELAADVLEVLPALLGADGERRYLIAFLNPSETRGLGGFMGSYAELSANAGEVSMTRSGNTFLDFTEDPASATWSISGPPEYLARYGPFQPQRFLHDVPYSPDFPTNATVLSELYPQATGTDIDGVISIDPYALAALLRFTGPISVAGLDEPLTEENAAQVLLADQYLQFDDFEQQRGRRQALDQVTEIAFSRLLSGDLPAPSALAEALSPAVREDRLMLFSKFEAEQALFAETGIAGAFERQGSGDVFSLISQNSGNNKIDTFLYRTIDYSVTYDQSSGFAAATATIELVNEAPAEGLPVYVLGNSLNRPRGTNIAYVSVYSSLDLADATLDGQPLALTSERELGLNVYSGFVEMAPKGSTTLVLDLIGTLQPGERYTLDYLSQPIVHPDAVTIAVTTAGSSREQTFESVSDELLAFG